MQTKKMRVFGGFDKLSFLNAYCLLEDTVESVKAGRRGNVELRSKEEAEAVLTEKVKCLSANISFQCI